MIEPSKLQVEYFKSEGKLCVSTKPFFCIYVLFFLAAGLFSIEQSITLELDLIENLLIFSFLIVLASSFGYVLLREGLFCFAADQYGWYFRNNGKPVLMYVPWADCHEMAKSTGEDTEIVFSVSRDATVSEIKPNNAKVSIDGDTLSIVYSGFIFFQAKSVHELNALRHTKIAKMQ